MLGIYTLGKNYEQIHIYSRKEVTHQLTSVLVQGI